MPNDIAMTPDGSIAYVTNQRSTSVSVIEISSNTVIDTITAAEGIENLPIAGEFTPNGTKAYVVNRSDANVSVVDTNTNLGYTTIPVHAGPRYIAIGLVPRI